MNEKLLDFFQLFEKKVKSCVKAIEICEICEK
jgi:hypothetical protein